MHVFMQPSEDKPPAKQMSRAFALGRGERRQSDLPRCFTHSRWKSGNMVDYFEVNNVRKFGLKDGAAWGWQLLAVFFFFLSSFHGCEGCSRTAGSFQCPSSAFALDALPLLGTGLIFFFYFFFFSATPTGRKLVQFKGAG